MRDVIIILKFFLLTYTCIVFFFAYCHFFFFFKPSVLSSKILTYLLISYENHFLSSEDIRDDRTIDKFFLGVNMHKIYQPLYKFFSYLKFKPVWILIHVYRLHIPYIMHIVRFIWFFMFYTVRVFQEVKISSEKRVYKGLEKDYKNLVKSQIFISLKRFRLSLKHFYRVIKYF